MTMTITKRSWVFEHYFVPQVTLCHETVTFGRVKALCSEIIFVEILVWNASQQYDSLINSIC